MRLRPVPFVLALALAGLWPGLAAAQAVAVEAPRPVRPSEATGLPVGLEGRLGLGEGRDLLFSLTLDERLRGVERLSTLGTPEAIEALLDATESGSPLSRDPLVRLAVVRALASHAGEPRVRAYLAREMLDAGGRRDVASPATSLVRDSAALALARQGDREAVDALVSAAMLRGQAGEAARAALIAEPPRAIDAILFEETHEAVDEDEADDAGDKAAKKDKPGARRDGKKGDREGDEGLAEKAGKGRRRAPRLLTPLSMTLLGDLGDLRAIPSLRAELDRSDRPSRAAAALALAKLGDASIAPVVRAWGEESDPRFVLAAAEVLAVLGDPSASELVARCLALEPVRGQALKLALDLASPQLVKPLLKIEASLDASERPRLVLALGRAGAVDEVAERLKDAELAPAAIVALAGIRSGAASERIAAGLASNDAAVRRAWTRVALVRVALLRERVSGMSALLDGLARSKDAADQELSAFGRVALDPDDLSDVLGDKPTLAVVAGAARAALASADSKALAPFGPLLRGLDPERVSPIQIAAGVGLLSPEVAREVPFDVLLRLAEGGGPLASLAARALPSRATEADAPRVRALLSGSDKAVRVGLALGLSESSAGGEAARLARAYQREDDPEVRRALVRALGRRPERQARAALALAARLDPDATARAAAAAPRPADPLGEAGLDRHAASFFRVSRAGAATDEPAVARVVLPSGLAVPVVTSADGGLLLAGVPFGRSTLELAPQPEPEHRPSR